MPGGLMQLTSQGQGNIILNGDPTKTFFTTKYAKYTNFSMQKFRIDYEGSTNLRLTEEAVFDFKILRYADLLMDTYFSITLPNIWSPIIPPNTEYDNPCWVPYEFKWIENLGYKMISNISVMCGNQKLCDYSGDYLMAMIQRDFKGEKRELLNRMTGNTCQFNNPAYYGSNRGRYPNAYYTENPYSSHPSILSKVLYIPIPLWFVLKSEMAFPLVSLQYNELHIQITLRPLCELFTIRDVYNVEDRYPEVAPNFNLFYMQMYRFLQPPPDVQLGLSSYVDTRTIWNTNIHLLCNYAFLSDEEQALFALKEQSYLIKQVSQKIFRNVTGSTKLDIDSLGMVSSWLFYFQRSDVNLRNQWSNYTNYPYNYVPNFVLYAPTETGSQPFLYGSSNLTLGPNTNVDGSNNYFYITSTANIENVEEILIDMAILLNGEYRENIQLSGVFNYIEKFTRTPNNAPDGLYCYNFCLNTDSYITQPSGAINMSQFKDIQIEFNTISPPLNLLSKSCVICDPETNNIVGIRKNNWEMYQYNFDLIFFEERINVITFSSGNCGLLWAL